MIWKMSLYPSEIHSVIQSLGPLPTSFSLFKKTMKNLNFKFTHQPINLYLESSLFLIHQKKKKSCFSLEIQLGWGDTTSSAHLKFTTRSISASKKKKINLNKLVKHLPWQRLRIHGCIWNQLVTKYLNKRWHLWRSKVNN